MFTDEEPGYYHTRWRHRPRYPQLVRDEREGKDARSEWEYRHERDQRHDERQEKDRSWDPSRGQPRHGDDEGYMSRRAYEEEREVYMRPEPRQPRDYPHYPQYHGAYQRFTYLAPTARVTGTARRCWRSQQQLAIPISAYNGVCSAS